MIVVLYVALAVLCALLYKWLQTKPLYCYPPGPPADPIIGHARVIPHKFQHLYFHKLREQYGDVIYLHALGTSLVVLNSLKAATELLDKRGLNYSDRPRIVMLNEILETGTLALMAYTKRAIKHRSLMTPWFTRAASRGYEPIQLRESQVLMNNLLKSPGEFMAHIRRFSTALVVEITYGHRVTDEKDEFLNRADQLYHVFANAGSPGTTPPDLLPILKYLPSWFPGAWWSRYGKRVRPIIRECFNAPFNHVLRRMAEGTAEPSLVQNVMQDLQSAGQVTKEDEEDAKEVASVIYVAGAETTWETLNVFFYLMILHPDVQQRAQQEIDSVVGLDCLPSFADRDSLPYVECILQEVLRWGVVLPMALPHCSKDDDIYDNMLIPKGSVVLANNYAINRDPSVYADAEQFDPTRFLPKPEGNGEPLPDSSFGYGRRVCPGKWTAQGSLWIVVAQTLAAFHISPAIGEDGEETLPTGEFNCGVTCQPKPYDCKIVPRSTKAAQLIKQGFADCS